MIAGVAAVVIELVRLIQDNWHIALSAMLGAAALALLIGNLGDLRHGRLPGPAPRDDDQE